MPPRELERLRELQEALMRAVLTEGVLADGAEPQGIAPMERLSIHRSTARSHFIDSLRSSYPVLHRLVGDDYFQQTVHTYRQRFPSRSGDLLPAGKHFAAFLAELHPAGEFQYFEAVARFEWLCQEALLAADAAPLDLKKLECIDPDDYDDLRFRLHPAARLFEAPFPIRRIWEANQHADAEPELIDLSEGADRLLILRHALKLSFADLAAGEFAFLRALHAGSPFGFAVEAGGLADAAFDAAFDAGAALRRWVGTQVIVDVVSPKPPRLPKSMRSPRSPQSQKSPRSSKPPRSHS